MGLQPEKLLSLSAFHSAVLAFLTKEHVERISLLTQSDGRMPEGFVHVRLRSVAVQGQPEEHELPGFPQVRWV